MKLEPLTSAARVASQIRVFLYDETWDNCQRDVYLEMQDDLAYPVNCLIGRTYEA